MKYCTPLKEFKELLENDLQKLVGRKFHFGGILNAVAHRVSKKGTGWGAFTLMDFDASYDFRMFGQDYINFKNYLDEGRPICFGVQIQEGWRNRETGQIGEPRMNFMHFMQMEGLLAKKSKCLQIKMPLQELSKNRIDTLQKILAPHQKGKNQKPFYIKIGDEKNILEMKSRTMNIEVCSEVLQALESEDFHFVISGS